jgi:hypothetical protein
MIGLSINRRMVVQILAVIECCLLDVTDCRIDLANGLGRPLFAPNLRADVR